MQKYLVEQTSVVKNNREGDNGQEKAEEARDEGTKARVRVEQVRLEVIVRGKNRRGRPSIN